MIFRIFLFLTLFVSCNQKDTTIEIFSIQIQKNDTTNNPNFTVKKTQLSESINKKIVGIWTNGSSDNAVLEIKDKTIYYVDQFEDYKYSLNGNQITINYPDYVYKAMIEFKADTLLMISKEYGKVKYWKFKE